MNNAGRSPGLYGKKIKPVPLSSPVSETPELTDTLIFTVSVSGRAYA